MRYLLLLLTACLLPMLPAQTTAETPRTLIILDASGSMWGFVDGEHKIDIAREVVSDLVRKLPENMELGLVAYGHRRKGDCADIELLIPPEKVDPARFLEVVNAIQPKGKTPIADSLRFAAEKLRLTEEPAAVILVSDGLETCGKDPCAVAEELEAIGVDFTAHVIGFDLAAEEAAELECIAQRTGGEFLPAQDAESLQIALETAVAQTATPKTVEPTPTPAPPDPATLEAPESVPAGSRFEVSWEGPNEPGDYITIVPAAAGESVYDQFTYTSKGNPLELRALIEPQAAELRYISRRAGVLGRRPITVVPIEASVEGPATAVVGSEVPVSWTGPNYQGDYITIVPKQTPDGEYARYGYTRKGSPLAVTAPLEPGEAEIRYMSGQGNRVLARAPIMLEASEVTLTFEGPVTAGARLDVEWTGPDNKGDYITIVPADSDEGTYQSYEYTRKGSPLKVKAPIEPGECEVRYVSGQGGKTLGAAPITVEEAEVSLEAPAEATAGAEVPVEWTGPANEGDYITIVPADAEEGTYKHYDYTRKSPAMVKAPIAPGACEVRYVSGQGGKTLAVTPIEVKAAEVSLNGPAEAVAGSLVPVQWEGPANQGDYITIVPAEFEEGKYAKYEYAREKNRPEVEVAAPMTAGKAEIRYVSGSGGKTLVAVPIEVKVAEITLKVPKKAAAGREVPIEWSGPDNPGDYITIVPAGTPEGQYGKYTYTREGSPCEVRAPEEAGPCEVRYVSGQGGLTLKAAPIEVVSEE